LLLGRLGAPRVIFGLCGARGLRHAVSGFDWGWLVSGVRRVSSSATLGVCADLLCAMGVRRLLTIVHRPAWFLRQSRRLPGPDGGADDPHRGKSGIAAVCLCRRVSVVES